MRRGSATTTGWLTCCLVLLGGLSVAMGRTVYMSVQTPDGTAVEGAAVSYVDATGEDRKAEVSADGNYVLADVGNKLALVIEHQIGTVSKQLTVPAGSEDLALVVLTDGRSIEAKFLLPNPAAGAEGGPAHLSQAIDNSPAAKKAVEAEARAASGGRTLRALLDASQRGGGPNDDCVNATPIGEVTNLPFNTTGASSDGPNACVGINTADIWFCYTPSCTGTATIDLCGSTYDTALAAYAGCGTCPPSLPALACNDDFCGFQSTITIPVTAGSPILIQVGGFLGATGAGDLTIVCTGTGGGNGADNCADAPAISGEGTFPFDNTAATTDGPSHAGCNFFGQPGIDFDLWWCWTATCDGLVTVETCGLTGIDSKIAIYDGCGCPVDDARLLACNDDSCGLQSSVQFTAVNGAQYLIRLGVFPGAPPGTGSFNIECTTVSTVCTQPPANCQNRDHADARTSDAVNFISADDFTPAASGSVTEICWWGTYFDGLSDCRGVVPDNITVKYYADAGGMPGALLATFSQTGGTLTVGGPVATGFLIAGLVPEYEYTGTHAPVPVTAGQCYWVEITNNLQGVCFWFWEIADPGNNRMFQDGAPPNGYDPGDLVNEDLSFCVNVGMGNVANCAPPPAGNDNCADATAIAGEGVFPFDNSAATTDGPPHAGCNFFGQPGIDFDVWFCWTSQCDGLVTVETCGLTGIDSKIAIYDGCACPVNDARLLACNDDSCGLQSRVQFTAVNGATYLIRLGVFPGAPGGAGSFRITCQTIQTVCTQPAGNCQNRDHADARTSDVVNFISADDFTPAASGSVTDICWWGTYFDGVTDCRGVVPDNITVKYYADAGGIPGALLASFSQTGGTLTVGGPVATGFQIAGLVPEYEYTGTHAPVPVTAGQCYWVEITNNLQGVCFWFWEIADPGNNRMMQDGAPPNGYQPGDLVLEDLSFCVNVGMGDVTNCAPAGPGNDDCADADAIAGDGTFAFDNSSATTDGPAHAGCDFFGQPGIDLDLWWCWTAPCTGEVTINTCGQTSIDSKIAVYDGCACPVTDARLIVCNDDFCGLQSQVQFSAVSGQQYLIRLGVFPGAAGGAGSFTISTQCVAGACCLPDGTCVNDMAQTDCEAQGGTYQGDDSRCEGGFLGYTASDCENAFENISGTGTQTPLSSNCDDCGDLNIPIGFTFVFFGTAHTTIDISSNGYLTFDDFVADFTNDPIPSPGAPNNIICPSWDDYNPGVAGEVYYQTLGSAPNRRFVVQWNNVPQFGNTDSNTFEAILFEGSNCIEFRYLQITPESPAGDYTIGVENADGTAGLSIPGSTIANGDCASICPNFEDPIDCPEPREACCFRDGSCLDLDPAACRSAGGTPQGPGTSCATVQCPPPPACDDCPPGSIPLVDADGDFSGWCVTTNRPLNVDIFVDAVIPGELALIQITKDFKEPPNPAEGGLIPAILLDFVQVCPDDLMAPCIFISDESISNQTGVDWRDFHWILFDGPEAWFDVAASAGFNTDPFNVQSFEDFIGPNRAKKLNVSGGVVPNGGAFFPGIGGGELVICTDLSGENPVSFTLKERPTLTGTVNLGVGSNANAVVITVSPQDLYGSGDGVAYFTRFYNPDATVTLTAPRRLADNVRFVGWDVNGLRVTNRNTVTLTLTADVSAEAVYAELKGRREPTPTEP